MYVRKNDDCVWRSEQIVAKMKLRWNKKRKFTCDAPLSFVNHSFSLLKLSKLAFCYIALRLKKNQESKRGTN